MKIHVAPKPLVRVIVATVDQLSYGRHSLNMTLEEADSDMVAKLVQEAVLKQVQKDNANATG